MGIVLRNVYAGYRRGEPVLRDVSMEIDSNTVILGPNGSGKTSLFRAIMGITSIARGDVLIDGVNIGELEGRPRLIATNLREVYLPFSVSIREMAGLYLDLMGGDYGRFIELIDVFNIREALGKKLRELSAGTRTLVLNSIALSSNARYVLLDEPFENVDPAKRSILLKAIVSYENVVVLNTHSTWLLRQIGDWKSYLVSQGRVYGPLSVLDLISSKISTSRALDVLLEIDIGDRRVFLTRNEGIPLSSLDTLDKLFEVIS